MGWPSTLRHRGKRRESSGAVLPWARSAGARRRENRRATHVEAFVERLRDPGSTPGASTIYLGANLLRSVTARRGDLAGRGRFGLLSGPPQPRSLPEILQDRLTGLGR